MENQVVSRSISHVPPAHFLLKIQTFSSLLENKVESYESSEFNVGSHKWKLVLYPNGNKKKKVKDHPSSVLKIKRKIKKNPKKPKSASADRNISASSLLSLILSFCISAFLLAWLFEGEFLPDSSFRVKFEYLKKRVLLFKVGGLGLMRIVRGMQRLFREELNKITLLSWKESFSQGIGITVPKARTRDKPTNTMIFSL